MTETYREENEANIGEESVAHRFVKGLEDQIGVANAFGSDDIDNKHDTEREIEDDEDANGFEMEIAMDDDSDEEEDPYELYDDNGGYN